MAVSAGYIASQNKRWQDANKNNDTDLMNRLQADSKRAGYSLDPYKAAAESVRNQVSSAPSAPSATPTQVTVPTSRANQTLNNMNELSQQQFQFKGPEAFNYNADSDPAYQAALQSARTNITQQQADTNARLRAGGQGKSSWSDTVANNIGAKEMANVSTNVLPQLISQAYQRYSDQASRDMQVQQANYGVQQDRFSNLGSLYNYQNNEDFNNPMQEAQLMGNYLPGEARQYIAAINNLKAQAETPGITANDRTALSQQADAYRAALQGLGVDPTMFGANVNLNTALANANVAGRATMAKQDQDFTQQFNTDRAAVSDNQWQQEFNQRVRQDGIDNAIRWANNSISQGHLSLAQQEAARKATEAQASSGKPANYNYKSDPAFASNIATINKADNMTIDRLLTDINNNPVDYITEYGYSGYEELLGLMNNRKKSLTSTGNLNDPFRNLLNR